MSARLSNFTQFANSLLPHEVIYLKSVQQFKDAQNIEILDLIYHNTHHPDQTFPYKTSIDKRKYSNLKAWINEKLQSINVDVFYEWLLETDIKIMTDSISPREEDALIRLIRNFEIPPYYFIRLYEIIRNYRFYLLIRFRHQYNRIVDRFLTDNQPLYAECTEINRKLHEATIDIVDQYALNKTESRKWEAWLKEVFYNTSIDGLNRYLAIVRLTLIYFNYKEYDKLEKIYNDLDQVMQTGQFYSRRILLNYYSNRVMLHSKRNELDKASTFGYLSIRQHSGDYLHYVNILCAVLLRMNQNTRALRLMQDAFPELKHTKSPHNRVGFASFYIRALNKNHREKEAADYAETFLNNYKEDIFEFRWHTFFGAYLQSLVALEKYGRVLRLSRKYKLLEQEQDYKLRAVYIPTVSWYYYVAAYKELEINLDDLVDAVRNPVIPLLADAHKCRLMHDLSIELHSHVPEVFRSDGNITGCILNGSN
ncbi:MAG: hypothetical protein RBS07_06855 [Lentimicrobium sp.]|jgi:hypothetical protein|nr:hypothetical protein [Lentimicrobium sp.]